MNNTLGTFLRTSRILADVELIIYLFLVAVIWEKYTLCSQQENRLNSFYSFYNSSNHNSTHIFYNILKSILNSKYFIFTFSPISLSCLLPGGSPPTRDTTISAVRVKGAFIKLTKMQKRAADGMNIGVSTGMLNGQV